MEEVSHGYSTHWRGDGRAGFAMLAVVAVGCSATATSSPSTTTSTPSNKIPSSSTVAHPWSAYWTSVNPGSAIDFVTARTK